MHGYLSDCCRLESILVVVRRRKFARPSTQSFLFFVFAFLFRRLPLSFPPRVSKRREILERLREEEARHEYIKWELGVAIGKAESRARRVKVANVVWDKWCNAKHSER